MVRDIVGGGACDRVLDYRLRSMEEVKLRVRRRELGTVRPFVK